MTETNVPRLRFRGFDEEWSEKKLNEVADRVTRKNKNLDSDLPLTISAQYGLVDQETFFNKKVASKDLSNYILVKRGEFAYNKSYSNGYPFGTIKSLKRYDMGVLSSLYIVFAIKENISHLFMDSFFDSNHWHKEVSTKTTEGARNHGLLNISPQDFMKSKIFVPNNIEEQNRIGLFISNLDNLIELQTKKLEQLKKLKQGYLQKMFPQDGESVPRLRFSEFSGEWKEEKLGCISNISNGVTGDVNLHDGKYKITRIETISDGRVNENKLGYIGYNPGENKLLKKGDILYSNINSISHIGKTAIFESASKIYHGINLTRISVGSEFNSYFINYLLNTPKYKLWSIRHANQAVSQASINNKDLSKMQITAPTLSEQKEVATFLLSLDKLIEEQSNKLDRLEKQKKAYLQKMFV